MGDPQPPFAASRSLPPDGSPERDTILLLEGIAGDDEADREVRETARKVVGLAGTQVARE